MGQAVGIFLPMLVFMLIPVLIPVVTSMIGRVVDALSAQREVSPAMRATEAARHAASTRESRPEVATVS
ncbi:hypothetical protein [Nocardioides cavernaquae]|uniref:Uncharacterized protein n=1 Tax=Nocardioides cavernaquae TaxID=2321396 RepID=A0A3A5HAP2_9ACTN|nr:hypothetical protein [Nocardioides cavernaquae]RJS46475.1 hypothetical protein D4739_09805 [Nocardioides cavernaquae]